MKKTKLYAMDRKPYTLIGVKREYENFTTLKSIRMEPGEAVVIGDIHPVTVDRIFPVHTKILWGEEILEYSGLMVESDHLFETEANKFVRLDANDARFCRQRYKIHHRKAVGRLIGWATILGGLILTGVILYAAT